MSNARRGRGMVNWVAIRWSNARAILVILLAFAPQSAAADRTLPPPKMDTTPVDITIGTMHYRIPRNFVASTGIAVLQAVFPGAKPMTPETATCFGKTKASRPPGCDVIEFALESSPMYVTDETFFRFRNDFHNQKPKKGPYGFDLYEIGPENSRIEAYRKVTPDGAVVANCMISDNNGQRDAVCLTATHTRSGIYAVYRFNLDELSELEDIHNGLRDLIDSFAVDKNRKP